jgi:hypothetical protein
MRAVVVVKVRNEKRIILQLVLQYSNINHNHHSDCPNNQEYHNKKEVSKK